MDTPERRTFRITRARLAEACAHGVAEDTGELVYCEFYVQLPASNDVLRMHVGDRVSGSLRGRYIQDVRFVEKTPPPPGVAAALVARLGADVEAYGVRLPQSADTIADACWRAETQGPLRVGRAVAHLVRAQFPVLLDWTSHPFDDHELAARLQTTLRERGIEIAIEQRVDECGDVEGFRVLPDGPYLPCEGGNWDAPQTSYQALVDFANEALRAHGAAERWFLEGENWLLAEPPLVALLNSYDSIVYTPPEPCVDVVPESCEVRTSAPTPARWLSRLFKWRS